MIGNLSPVKDFDPKEINSFKDMIVMYRNIYGFMASHIARAYDILIKAFSRADTIFLSFTGNLIATGLRGVISWFLKKNLFDVVITTCGAIDHDIARSFKEYYGGFFEADDKELSRIGIHRLGNIFIPVDNYGKVVEEFAKKLLYSIKNKYPDKYIWTPSEIINEAALLIPEHDENKSFIKAAKLNNIPIFVPGIADGAFGSSLMFLSSIHSIKLDVLGDLKKLADIVFSSDVTAALIIGGGISKHHTLWWNQFKQGLKYVVYITTAIEYDGSLSGAHPREAITWGKISSESESVVVYADATIILPLLALVFNENGIKRESRKNTFSHP